MDVLCCCGPLVVCGIAVGVGDEVGGWLRNAIDQSFDDPRHDTNGHWMLVVPVLNIGKADLSC